MEETIKIVIVDDKERFRDCLKKNLKMYPVSVIGEAENGVEVLKLLNNVRPDVMLLDLEMPVMDGNKTFSHICKDFPGINVIIISSYYEDILLDDYTQRGAKGFIPKDVMTHDLLFDALKRVKGGDTFFYEDPKKFTRKFSYKQREIIPFIFEGKTNKEIAPEVNISERAVEKQRTKIYRLTGAERAIDFYKYAFARGMQFLGKKKKETN